MARQRNVLSCEARSSAACEARPATRGDPRCVRPQAKVWRLPPSAPLSLRPALLPLHQYLGESFGEKFAQIGHLFERGPTLGRRTVKQLQTFSSKRSHLSVRAALEVSLHL